MIPEKVKTFIKAQKSIDSDLEADNCIDLCDKQQFQWRKKIEKSVQWNTVSVIYIYGVSCECGGY